jgi:hypothetical protein
MNATNPNMGELERLVDRHIELCELFDGTRALGRPEPPLLVTTTEGKTVADCIADLVDRALVTYGSSGIAQDSTIFALKAALIQVIAGKLD